MIRLGVLFILVLLIAGAARVVGILSFLIILGGIVSYLGDLLGSYFGKRRLSIFGLRPKNTGTLISLMTGTMITIATLGGAMLISEDYKDALLNYRKLKSDQESLVRINQDLKTNEEKLTRVNSELKSKEVELTRVLEGVEASFDRISGELKEAEEVRAGLAEEIEELRRDKEEKLEQIRLLARALKQ